MATANKTTARKTAAKTPVKKGAVKKKTTAKKATPVKMRSFRVAANDPTFRTFKITFQTVYWVLILSVIIFLQLWILKLQLDAAIVVDLQQQSVIESEN